MFQIITLEDEIRIPPSELTKPRLQASAGFLLLEHRFDLTASWVC